jgi:hypothetical protein
MSNRFQERITLGSGGGGGGDVTVVGWNPGVIATVSVVGWSAGVYALTDVQKQAGTLIGGPIQGDAVSPPGSPLFSTSSVLYGYYPTGDTFSRLTIDSTSALRVAIVSGGGGGGNVNVYEQAGTSIVGPIDPTIGTAYTYTGAQFSTASLLYADDGSGLKGRVLVADGMTGALVVKLDTSSGSNTVDVTRQDGTSVVGPIDPTIGSAYTYTGPQFSTASLLYADDGSGLKGRLLVADSTTGALVVKLDSSSGANTVDVAQQDGTAIVGPIDPTLGTAYTYTGAQFSTASLLYADDGTGNKGQLLKVDANTGGLLVSGPTATVVSQLATTPFVYAPLATDSADITPTPVTLKPGTKQVTFWVTYTQGFGSTASYIVVYPVWNNGSSVYRDVALDPGTYPVSSREASFTIYNSVFQTAPVAYSGAAMTLSICLDVPAGATAANLICRESGGNGTAGAVAIEVTTGG